MALVLAAVIVALSASAASASVLWTAGAEGSLSSGWASGNAYDVNASAGSVTTSPAWATSTRVQVLIGCMGTNSASTGITAPSGFPQAWQLGLAASELADGAQPPAAGASGAKT